MLARHTLVRGLKSTRTVLKFDSGLKASRQFSTSTRNMATVSEKITHDHRELEEYYNNILNASDNDPKPRWQNQSPWDPPRHSLAEELVVYPAMEKHVP